MKKISSILLAVFFLLSSSHLSFATHYCGGHSFSHELLLSAEDVGCDMANESSKEQMDECDNDHDCCDTQLIEFSIKDNFQAPESKVSFTQHFVLANVVRVLFSFSVKEQNIILYQDYKPPLPEKDIPVLFQSFLI